MALSTEDRIALLNRAVELESRSFLEYLAQSAPPYDIEKYPEVARTLAEIAREEDLTVEDLVGAMEAMGGHPDALGSYDLNFTFYNYLSTEHALKVLAEQLGKGLARLDAVLAEAGGDELEPRLTALRERKAAQVARIEELRSKLR